MAKMGQPMLPILPPQLDSNDSEIEVCPTGCLRMNSADVAVFCSFFFFFFNIYLFDCPGSAACGMYPDQGLNPGPLHWECRVLAPGLPGRSLSVLLIEIIAFPASKQNHYLESL